MSKTFKKLLSLSLCLLMVFGSIAMGGNGVATFGVTADASALSGSCGTNATWHLDYQTGILTISGTGAIADYSPSSTQGAPWAFLNSGIKKIIINPGITSIGNYSFYWLEYVEEAILPCSLTSVGEGAFYRCEKLTEISLPDSVATIGINAFCECKSLTSFRIPKNVTRLDINTFADCSGLVNLTFSKNLATVDGAFGYCDNIKNVYYEGSEADKANISIGTGNNGNGNFSNAVWHYSYGDSCSHQWETGYCTVTEPTATTVGEGSCGCKYCYAKKSVEIPTVKGATVLKNAPCGDNLTWTFDENTGTLTISGTGDMYDYSSGTTNSAPWRFLVTVISYIVVEEGVTSIGKNAITCSSDERQFMDISVLTLPSTMKSIATYAFGIDRDIKCVFYNGTEADSDSYGFKSVAELISSTWYFGAERYTDDGVTYAVKDGNAVVAACAYKKTGKVTIPEKINGNTVTKIANRAFYDCNDITEVILPDTVTVISEAAFQLCLKLKTVNIPTGLTTLGTKVFRGCNSLSGQINIPEGVTEIPSDCFIYCNNLKTVTLPSTLTTISSSAFNYSGIKNVYYSGKCDKSEITIKGNNAPINNATWYMNHSITKTDAKKVTCTEDGNNEYYYCSGCEKYFLDEAGTTETTVTAETITASGHEYVDHEAQAPTCTEIGWNAYQTCKNCDYTSYVEIPAKGHDYVDHEAQAATCTEIGWDAYQTCKNCDYTTYVEIAAKGHEYVDHEAQAPTCTEIGWNAYQTCKNCEYTTYEEISATGHNWGEWTDGVRACLNEGCVETDECAHDGVKAGETCPICGTVLPEASSSSYSIAALIAAIITLFLTLFGFIAVRTAA